jgi:hypothetical protein
MAADAAERQLKTLPDREAQERTLSAVERMSGKWRELSGATPIEEPSGRELTATERRVIEYKFAHPEATQGAMARALRLSREHVNRILGDEAVRSKLHEITVDALGQADKVTSTLTRAAVLELDRIARDGNARTTARLRAMKCLRRFAGEVQALGERKAKPLDLAKMTAEGVTSYSKALRALGHEVYKAVGLLLGPRSEEGEDEGPPDYAAALEDLPAELRTALRHALLTDPERLRVVIPEHVMEIVEPLLMPPA